MNVLIVDDSEMTRMVAKNALDGASVEGVFEAEDGVEALKVLDAEKIDIVFSDWNMPNMSGIELLQKVREKWPEMPFIMITTEGSKERVMEAIQHGVSDYLAKPFTPPALVQKISKWVTTPA